MSIRDWPEDERPREKLLSRGAASLSDSELLAIFLRTGIAGQSAVELARDLIKRFGSLRAILEASRSEFCMAKGLGDAKFAQLQAVLEMGRRHLQADLAERDVFHSPAEVKRFLTLQLRHVPQEIFVGLFLTSQHQLIAYEVLFNGTVNQASVYPREVVKRALHHNAAALIVAHNHPSGVAEPSQSDIHITRQLQQALALVEVRLLDHLVVGGEVVSLAERGVL